MRKNNLLLLISLLFFANFSILAQIPDNYYEAAMGKKGYELQKALAGIIEDHFVLDYGSTDAARYMDFTTDGYLYDIYSHPCCQLLSPGTAANAQCQKYSFEHLFCQSWFNPDSVYNCGASNPFPICSDLHHVFPTDHYVNSSYHNDAPYGEVAQPRKIAQNGTRWGYANYEKCDSSIMTRPVFEPANEFKGDIARALLYVAICYMNMDQNFGESSMTIKSQFKPWALQMLKKWSALDPVSQKEIDRNNAIFNHFQHNRNPLIDYPELIELIWGSDSLYNTFGNIGELDAQRPEIEDLTFTETQIVITFTQEMDSATAVDVTHYDCTKGVAFASAIYSAENKQVTLTMTRPLTRNTGYQLYISDIKSTNGLYVKPQLRQFVNGCYNSPYDFCKEPRYVITAWTFDDFAITLPLSVPANTDEGFVANYTNAYLYADGRFGSTLFDSIQLKSSDGELGGDPRTAAKKTKALKLCKSSANGQSIVLRFATTNWKEIMFSFTDTRTATGFAKHSWEWSLDGENYNEIANSNTISDYGQILAKDKWLFRELDLRELDVNNKDSVFLRLTIDSASGSSGSNTFDNFVVYGEPLDYECDPTHPAVHETAPAADFLVYPNPNNGHFNVEWSDANQFSSCQIFDLAGKLLLDLRPTENNLSINMNNFPNGLYFIKMHDQQSGKSTIKKIIITK